VGVVGLGVCGAPVGTGVGAKLGVLVGTGVGALVGLRDGAVVQRLSAVWTGQYLEMISSTISMVSSAEVWFHHSDISW